MSANLPLTTTRNSSPFNVGNWRVDPAACRLERGGKEVRVEPKVMQLLAHLAERSGEVVSRQELERVVWSDTVVGYEAVTNAVIKLRKALQDDARNPHIIETISKGGYRLIADVIPAPDDSEAQPGQLEPKLAAILYAHAAGYSRLTGEDKEGIQHRLNSSLDTLSNTSKLHGGNVVQSAGNTVLADFGTVTQALICAVEIQHKLRSHNEALSEEQRIEYRIGIDLGGLTVDQDDICGDGVAVATGLERLADPGGICVSESVHSAIHGKSLLGFESLGERRLKNVAEPVRAYRIMTLPGEVGGQRGRHKPVIAVVAALLAIAVGVGAWFYYDRPGVKPASVDNMLFPLPKEPSIAVLPFDNLSDDEEQDFLVDGLTEDIITALAKSPYLFVIARNSTLKYKEKPVSVKQVAEELGVRHVLEGSVQRDGERVRITAQLIDALTGRHVWAQHYDREFKDIFALQDDITEKIMVALHVEITEGYDYSDFRARVRTPEAFELLMKARVLALRDNKVDSAMARQLVARAAAIEPDNPEIWLYQAWGHWRVYQNQWSEDPQASLDKAVELGEKAYAATPNYSAATGFLGLLSLSRGEHEKAIEHGRESVELAPGSALDNARLAWFLTVSGHPEEAIALTQKAMRLSPSYPAWFAGVLGFSYMITGRHRDAIALYEQLVERETGLLRAYTRLAGNHAVLGETEKARQYAEKALEIKPDLTVQGWKKYVWYRYPDDLERELDMLRLAGLPEGSDD